MTDFATFFTGFLGFFAGQVMFVGVLRWAVTVYEIAKNPAPAEGGGKGLNIAMASIFGSGPWLIVGAVMGATFVRNEPFAEPLFVGAALGIAAMSLLGLWILRVRAKNRKNAA